MRRVTLLILLCLTSLHFIVFVAAQGPKHPEAKRRGRESAPTDKAGKWSREQKAEVKRGPERESVDKKATTREERPGGRPRTRDKAGAWDRRQDRSKEAQPVERRNVEGRERDKRSGGRRTVEKASRWEKQPKVESRSVQEANFREHVFRGSINGRGRPVGFHYEGARGRPADGIKVVDGSRSKPDANGVYKAELEARGIKKGYHTFFPRSWSRVQVEKAINEAYANRVRVGKASNSFEGKSSSGVTVGMKCNKYGELVTAYPKYEP